VEGPIRVTSPLLDVLEAFLEAFDSRADDLHGWAIMKATKRSGPTVYGVLDRLEDAGWISGRWEDENPEPGKPRRRLYSMTPTGLSERKRFSANAARMHCAPNTGRLAWRCLVGSMLCRTAVPRG
jgi:PadR family transcriptional regulator, regulatory protein PadR